MLAKKMFSFLFLKILLRCVMSSFASKNAYECMLFLLTKCLYESANCIPGGDKYESVINRNNRVNT